MAIEYEVKKAFLHIIHAQYLSGVWIQIGLILRPDMPVALGIILNFLLKSINTSCNCQYEYQKPDQKTEPKVYFSKNSFSTFLHFRTYNLSPEQLTANAEG